MKVIFILSDSLNRHFLPSYGNEWVLAPNITRFAESSVVFDNHWLGSAPCMPARRDILTGRINFLEREWGGIEPFDRPFPFLLKQNGIHTHMETDHYHYFHVGGENYHTPFCSWRFHRGQEWDHFVSRVSHPHEPEHLGKWSRQYEKNREAFAGEDSFPTPKTFKGAVQWLQDNEDEDDYFLWLEVFDPHEPFDCLEKYMELYRDQWKGPSYNWSGYERVDGNSDATSHLRRSYAATLTMMDYWFGELIKELERQNSLEDTLIIFTTDHGHMLGEHGATGKNLWHAWNEMAHIPLIVHLPGSACAGERRTQLTQNTDVLPTVMEYFGLPVNHPIHGRSWRDILEKNLPSERDCILYGWYGQTVNLTDGKCTYFRSPAHPDNQPLYHYFLTPGSYNHHDICQVDFYANAELGNFLPYTDYPVIKAKKEKPRGVEYADTRLYDITKDYHQEVNLAGTEQEDLYRDLLVSTMKRMDAPEWQFERLGL